MKPEQVTLYEALLGTSKSLADSYADLCVLHEIYVEQVLAASRTGDADYEEYVARLQSIRNSLRIFEWEAIKYTKYG